MGARPQAQAQAQAQGQGAHEKRQTTSDTRQTSTSKPGCAVPSVLTCAATRRRHLGTRLHTRHHRVAPGAQTAHVDQASPTAGARQLRHVADVHNRGGTTSNAPAPQPPELPSEANGTPLCLAARSLAARPVVPAERTHRRSPLAWLCGVRHLPFAGAWLHSNNGAAMGVSANQLRSLRRYAAATTTSKQTSKRSLLNCGMRKPAQRELQIFIQFTGENTLRTSRSCAGALPCALAVQCCAARLLLIGRVMLRPVLWYICAPRCVPRARRILANASRGLSIHNSANTQYMGMDRMFCAPRVLYALLPSVHAKHTPCSSTRCRRRVPCAAANLHSVSATGCCHRIITYPQIITNLHLCSHPRHIPQHHRTRLTFRDHRFVGAWLRASG